MTNQVKSSGRWRGSSGHGHESIAALGLTSSFEERRIAAFIGADHPVRAVRDNLGFLHLQNAAVGQISR